ncbi:MAG: hypothetical protein HGB32_08075 [Geobacteraceae bacterium]|nr:hypothetical protein [Geobacteraceae bacterium]NTW80089.1 hypothetical protein [Geobacteraceae bacterium]
MQKYVQYIFVLLIVACLAACGGSDSTTAVTQVYGRPATLVATPPNNLVGGAVKGSAIATKASYSTSTFTGTTGTDGIGFTNYSGNSSVTAKFNQPNDITTDGTDFYVADYGNSIIRRIYTVAGEVRTSTLQCKDSDGNAISFYSPRGITTDGTYLYVSDSGNHCIRVITIAADNDNKHKVITIGSTDGTAGSVDSTVKTTVRFNLPTGITTDGVNVYVTDYNNATVRWIDTSDRTNGNYAVYTMAGASGVVGSTDSDDPSTARFNLPTRITTDGINLYVTDIFNRTIRQIGILTGKVTTLAGIPGPLDTGSNPGSSDSTDGTGGTARFYYPNGITTDGTNLYVTDSWYGTIRKVVISTGEVTTLSLSSGRLLTPVGITINGSSLYVVDTYYANTDDDYTITYSNSILKIE